MEEQHGPNAFASAPKAPEDRDGTVAYGLFKHLVNEELDRGTSTVRRTELHADYTAGWFAGVRARENRAFSAAEVAMAQFQVGDFNRSDPQHHGTPEERGEAVRQGFHAAKRGHSFSDAFAQGIRWAKDF